MITRRDAFRAIGGLGLIACDGRKPHRDLLGASERMTEHVQSFLLSDRRARAGELTPEDAFPIYHIALDMPAAPPSWRLAISGAVDNPVALSLDELMKLPRIEERIEHHCVEGWSAVATWTGVRISELARLVRARDVDYVEFRSFDVPKDGARGYWSSWDRDSAMHPQTMVAYGMNGKPLTPAHGAPARLYAAVKLGYKQVKYLTEINFLPARTGGYWEDLGYEWFAGT